MIPLHTNADGLATSLSRFVLAIRYELLPWKDNPIWTSERSEWEFVETEPDDLETRSSYLTSETSYALFERGKWFRLKSKSGGSGSTPWETFSFDAPPL